MHKKFSKAAASSFMAAAMLTSTVVSAAPSVFAGSCLGESTFKTKGLPWHTCVTSPAEQEYSIDKAAGVYRVKITNVGGKENGGDSRWDVQFRHRKLHIESGHKYKISFDINASNDGELATHIADLKGGNPVWLSGHGGTQCWNYSGQECPDGHTHTKNSSNLAIKKGDNHFEGEFTAENTLEVAEWAFHYGGAGEWQANDCFPVGTVLEFSNMHLDCETCGSTWKEGSCLWDPNDTFGVTSRKNSGLADNYISVNQVGYFTKLAKKATLGDNAGGDDNDIASISLPSSSVPFTVVDSSGKAAYTGQSTYFGKDEDSGDNCHILDFSELQEPGTYHIECEGYKSFDFKIGDDIYSESGHDLLTNAMNYYYQNRSGIAIESSYITSGNKSELAHPAGHTKDDAYVQPKWQNAYAGEFDGEKTYTVDCKGGWYDAGDHGKYVVNGGISVWTLQNLYERSLKKGTDSKFADGSGAVVIPENGNKYPDILDEARYELDWMMNSMVVDSKDPYWGKYAGLVYHKMHDHKWTGLATKPWEYENEWGTTRIVKPPSLAATANFAACAAQASRLWKEFDSSYAEKLLEAAKKSYAAYKEFYYEYGDKAGEGKDGNKNETSLYAPGDQAKGGGPYGDDKASDDGYWAACELFATTGDSSYYSDLSAYADAFKVVTTLEGGENASSLSSFNWGCTGSLGSLSLYLNPENVDAGDVDKIKASIEEAASTYIKKEDEQGYGIPYRGSVFTDPNNIGTDDSGNLIEVHGYEWGSNSFVINNAIVMGYAYDITGDAYYLNGAVTAMDYLLGRNPLSYSFISGYGSYCLKSPHHRWWSKELDKEFPACPDGVLSGGCGSGLQDPYVAGLGYVREQVAPQRCYVDSCEAWSVNEVTINWNAPLVWVASFLQDEAGGDIKPTESRPTETKPTETEPTETEPTDDTTESTESTESTTKKTTASSDDNTEPTESSTKETTASSDDNTEPTESSTKKTTASSDDNTEPTESSTKKTTASSDDNTEPTESSTKKTTASTSAITGGSTANTDKNLVDKATWGDVNLDENVNVSDVVALNLFILNSTKYALEPQGYVNANVKYDEWVNISDSTTLMNYVAEIIGYELLGPHK